MRLAIAAPRHERCGIADYARQLADALPADFRIEWIEFPSDRSAHAWRDAAAQADGAQAVHVHYESSLFVTVKPYRNRFATFMNRLRPPCLVTLHDAVPQLRPRCSGAAAYGVSDALRDIVYLPFFPRWESRQYRRGAHWLVHSPTLADKVSRLVGSARVSLLPHPIPHSAHRWQSEAPKAGTLVTPGFVKAHKGYEDVLDAVAAHPEWTWIVAGGPQNVRDAEYLAQLHATIRALGIEQQVQVTDYLPRERLEHIVAQAQLAVFPFRWAVGSGSLAWAIAMGMPILASDLASIRALRDAGAGIALVLSEPRPEWGPAIAGLLADDEQLALMARRNAAFAERHGYAHCAAAVADIVRRLASAHPSYEARP